MVDTILDKARADAFMDRMVDVFNHAGLALMISIGHRCGLFDAMASLPPSTSSHIAKRTLLSERYVREWLGAMTTGGIVEYDAAAKTYRLPQEHAAALTRASRPGNIAAAMQWVAVLGGAEDDVIQAFRHGQGVPYSAYPRFHEVMAEGSDQTVIANLMDRILPLEPNLVGRLQKGIDVLDVGCGSGWAIIEMARHFPASRFCGYDLSDEGIAAARKAADAAGVNNARFAVCDAAAMSEQSAYDLITAFDAIHDQARPDRVLANVARALKPDGLFLMQDISGTSRLEDDMDHPFAPFLYTISCMHCMSVSLAAGGPGLGAMWGKELALKMLADAGFDNVRVERIAHDPLNYYYLARK